MEAARRVSDRGDPLLRSAIAALTADRVAEVREALRDSPGLAAEIRAHGIAAAPEVEAPLQRWCSTAADDPDVHLLLAIRRLDDLPWLGAQLEEQRSAEQQHFDDVESLWRAVEHLQLCLDAEPARPAGRTWMAAVVGALVWRGAMPMADFERCAAEAEEVLPESLHVARWRVHLAEAEPDADPVAVAETAAKSWDDGDVRHAEVASAHVARYRQVLEGENADAATAYWQRSEVHDSLVAADGRVGTTLDSVAGADAASVMAFTLARGPEPRLAWRHFERLAGGVLTWPWAMLRDPVGAYGELADRARPGTLSRLRRALPGRGGSS